MICSLTSNVNDATLETITNLEKDLGKTLLAFSCHDLKASTLDADQLNKIQELEKKLGVSLVAVET
jgi:cell wall assembly regulator SMI1